METFIALHSVITDPGKGSSNVRENIKCIVLMDLLRKANSSELVVSNIIKWITNESYKVGIDIENVKRLRVQLSMRILEILFARSRSESGFTLTGPKQCILLQIFVALS